MNSEPIDLAGQKTWRVFPTEDHVPGSRVDAWACELRGPGGSAIYPAGGSELAAYCKRRVLRSQLESLGRVTQRGDFELTIRFPADRLPEVATLLKCYRKKAVSAKALAALAVAREKAAALRADGCTRGPTDSGSDDRAGDEICFAGEIRSPQTGSNLPGEINAMEMNTEEDV